MIDYWHYTGDTTYKITTHTLLFQSERTLNPLN
jgi:hypothetical protein